MSNQVVSIRMQLREQTAELHQRVDALGSQLAPVSSPAGCRIFLQTIERALQRHGGQLDRASELAGLPQRSSHIRAALHADLSGLGVSGPATLASPARACVDHSADADAAAWGVGYVLEGSALGAALLLEEIEACDAILPTAYFSLLVNERPGRWASFSAALNDAGMSSAEVSDAVVVAATEVFHLVEASFQELSNCEPNEVVGHGS